MITKVSCFKVSLVKYTQSEMKSIAKIYKGDIPYFFIYIVAAECASQSGDDTFVHYGDVIMGMVASQIASINIVYSTVYSGADQRKHQSSATLAFAQGIHRSPVNSPHKWPVTRKMFPFDDVIMGQFRLPLLSTGISSARKRWILNMLINSSPLGQNGPLFGRRQFQMHFLESKW